MILRVITLYFNCGRVFQKVLLIHRVFVFSLGIYFGASNGTINSFISFFVGSEIVELLDVRLWCITYQGRKVGVRQRV